MARMSFPTAVKYNGVNYNAREPFTVKDSDVEELRKKGGWVLESKKTKKETSK